MAHIYKRRNYYRIQYRDQHGKIRDVRGFSQLKPTQIEASRIEDQVLRLKRGIVSPVDISVAESEAKLMATHLEEWRRDVIARGNTVEHADLLHYRVSRVFEFANGGKGYQHLSQVAPVEVQSIIKRLMDEGLAQQTANHVIQSCKQFSRWLFRNGRTRIHALDHLIKYAVTKIQHDRVNISWEDVSKMIACVESQKKFQQGGNFKLRGVDRGMMYRTAIATGLRRRALQSLTPANFDLTPGRASVTAPAGYTKNKKSITLPLPDYLAALLKEYLSGKAAGKRLWAIPMCSSRMIRADFKKAGITFPDDAKVRDFHSLRHTYITTLVESGADLKTVQEMAGHCTIALTGRYAHSNPDHKRNAVNALPVIQTPPKQEGEKRLD